MSGAQKKLIPWFVAAFCFVAFGAMYYFQSRPEAVETAAVEEDVERDPAGLIGAATEQDAINLLNTVRKLAGTSLCIECTANNAAQETCTFENGGQPSTSELASMVLMIGKISTALGSNKIVRKEMSPADFALVTRFSGLWQSLNRKGSGMTRQGKTLVVERNSASGQSLKKDFASVLKSLTNGGSPGFCK